MRVLDIFCGTKSVGKICKERNWEYIGLDINPKFSPEICVDFLDWDFTKYDKNYFDAIWISPDCACYSMAAGNRHFNADRTPKTDKAFLSLILLEKVKCLIEYYNCIYFIENPRARMRWFLNDYPRYTIWYCQYGFDRAKPTDIWSNIKGFIPRTCYNGCPDHISAPRGSHKGTDGAPKTDRYKVPPQLIRELFDLKPFLNNA
jgi:hypothetical protein